LVARLQRAAWLGDTYSELKCDERLLVGWLKLPEFSAS